MAPTSSGPDEFVHRDALDERTRARHDAARGRKQRLDDRLRSVEVAFAVLVGGAGIAGALHAVSWRWVLFNWRSALWSVGLGFPLASWVIHELRHVREARPMRLPPWPPAPCTFFNERVYLGSAWTADGALPGEILQPADEPLEPHLSIEKEGLFAHALIEGAPGTGKTDGALKKILAQVIRKYPVPPELRRDEAGRWIAIPAWDDDEAIAMWRFRRRWAHRLPARYVAAYERRRFQSSERVSATLDPLYNGAYGGITTEAAAEARRTELLRLHRTKRPAILVLNPKSEERGNGLTEFVLRAAAADSPERLAQVHVLSPELGTSIATFDTSRSPADLADTLKRAIEILDGKGDNYWAGKSTELVTHVFSIARALTPGRVTWQGLLESCADQEFLASQVRQATALMEEQLAAERRQERDERRAVDHVALQALTRFAELDKRQWEDTTSRINAFSRHVLADDVYHMMGPEVPTLGSLRAVIERGDIIVVDMPLARYGSVAKAVGTLIVNAFISASTAYGGSVAAAERRPSAIFLDEVHQFVTEELERALAMARAADVAFILALQTTQQLDGTGRRVRQTFATTCQNRIVYRDPDGVNANEKSESFGSTQEYVESHSVNEAFGNLRDHRGTGMVPRSVSRSASVNMSLRDVPRFRAEVIQRMPKGRAIVSVTDGTDHLPPRLVSTPRCEDVVWLADIGVQPLPTYVPPIPIGCVLPGAAPVDTLDQLTYLYEIQDPTRDATAAFRVLRERGRPEPWGLLVWVSRFGFVISRQHLAAQRHVFEKLIQGPRRMGEKKPLPPPTLIFADLAEARTVEELVGVSLIRPLPLDEALAAVREVRPEEADALAARLLPVSSLPGDYIAMGPVAWRERSESLRRVFEVQGGLGRIAKSHDAYFLQNAQERWLEVLHGPGHASAPSGDPDPEASRQDGGEGDDIRRGDGGFVPTTAGSSGAVPMPTDAVAQAMVFLRALQDDAPQALTQTDSVHEEPHEQSAAPEVAIPEEPGGSRDVGLVERAPASDASGGLAPVLVESSSDDRAPAARDSAATTGARSEPSDDDFLL